MMLVTKLTWILRIKLVLIVRGRGDYCGQKMTIATVLTLQEVPLRYSYYYGLPLKYYCDTIVQNIYASLKQEIKIVVARTFLYIRVPVLY